MAQGNTGQQKRAPDTVPGKACQVRWTVYVSACTKGQESQVQQSVSPSHGRTTTASVLGAKKRQASAGVDDVTLGAVPSSTGCPHPGLARSPSTAAPTEQSRPVERTFRRNRGWRATSSRHRIAGGQDRPACGCRDPRHAIHDKYDFVGFSYAGFALGREDRYDALDALLTGIRDGGKRELGARRWISAPTSLETSIDHDWVLEVLYRAQDSGHEDAAPHPKVVERWDSGEGPLDEEQAGWNATGSDRVAPTTGEHLLCTTSSTFGLDAGEIGVHSGTWSSCATPPTIWLRASNTGVMPKRFRRELRERFAKFALELHTEKTRLLRFGRLTALPRGNRVGQKGETFNCCRSLRRA